MKKLLIVLLGVALAVGIAVHAKRVCREFKEHREQEKWAENMERGLEAPAKKIGELREMDRVTVEKLFTLKEERTEVAKVHEDLDLVLSKFGPALHDARTAVSVEVPSFVFAGRIYTLAQAERQAECWLNEIAGIERKLVSIDAMIAQLEDHRAMLRGRILEQEQEKITRQQEALTLDLRKQEHEVKALLDEHCKRLNKDGECKDGIARNRAKLEQTEREQRIDQAVAVAVENEGLLSAADAAAGIRAAEAPADADPIATLAERYGLGADK